MSSWCHETSSSRESFNHSCQIRLVALMGNVTPSTVGLYKDARNFSYIRAVSGSVLYIFLHCCLVGPPKNVLRTASSPVSAAVGLRGSAFTLSSPFPFLY